MITDGTAEAGLTAIEKLSGEIEGTVVARVNVYAREAGYFVGLYAYSFESNTAGGAIVKLADVQNAAVREGVSVSNRQHATTGFSTDDARAPFRLQRRHEDLRGARGVFTRQHNERKCGRQQTGNAPQTLRKSLQLKRSTGAIRKLSEVRSVVEKERRYVSHRFRIATAVGSQIENDAFSALQNFGQHPGEVERDALRECVNSENRDLSFSLVVESQLSLAPVTLEYR